MTPSRPNSPSPEKVVGENSVHVSFAETGLYRFEVYIGRNAIL